MFSIKIPKPCTAAWTEMIPTQKGAFCGSCEKEVVDFTDMTDEAVKNYFLHKREGSTCGRFRTEQVHRIRITLPEDIFQQQTAGWKKYLAIVLLAFGSMLFGCDVGTGGLMMGKAIQEESVLTGDTILVENNQGLKGKVAIDTTVTTSMVSCKLKIDTISYQGEIMGDISIVPVEPVLPEIIMDPLPPEIKPEPYLMGEPAVIITKKPNDTLTKKPVSDTGKCKDTGFY